MSKIQITFKLSKLEAMADQKCECSEDINTPICIPCQCGAAINKIHEDLNGYIADIQEQSGSDDHFLFSPLRTQVSNPLNKTPA